MSPVLTDTGLGLLVFGAVAVSSTDAQVSRLGFVYVTLAVVVTCLGVMLS